MSVLDASVALKWFVDEEDSDAALSLRQNFRQGESEIVVPDLLLYEVANALRFNPSFEAQEVNEAVKTLLDMEIDIVTPSSALLEKLVDLSVEHGITCYDSTYFALAQEIGFPLITADEKLYNKLPQRNKESNQVKLLAELK